MTSFSFPIELGISDVIGFVLATLVISISIYYYRYFTRPNPLKGPFPYPFIGNLHQYNGDMFAYTQDLHQQYGDIFEIWFGFTRRIIISHPKYCENLANSSQNSPYIQRVGHHKGFVELGIHGKGVAFNDVIPAWKRSRQFMIKLLISPTFLKQMVPWVQEKVEELDGHWSAIGDENVIELTSWIRNLFTDIIWKFTTGKQAYAMHSYHLKLSPGTVQSQQPENTMNESRTIVEYIFTFIMSYNHFLYPTVMRHYFPRLRKKTKYLLHIRDQLFDTVTCMIQKRRGEIQQTPRNQQLSDDMLTGLLIANTDRDQNPPDEEQRQPVDNEEIIMQLVDAFTGGLATSVSTFCFITYYLGQNPDIKLCVQKELREFYADKPNGEFTYQDLGKLEYCEAVIKETMRLLPAGPLINRRLIADDDQWNGGSMFILNLIGLHQHKDFWENPLSFNPDRFLNGKVPAKNAYFPFGFGTRTCIGKKLVMVELKCLMALIFHHWDLDLVDKNAPLKYDYRSSLLCRDLFVRLKSRKNE